MNRKQTRATARAKPVNRVVAIHEAGHAVGCYMTASLLGIDPRHAIGCIDIGQRIIDGGHVNGISQATTHGFMFSKEINDFLLADLPAGAQIKQMGHFDFLSGIAKARAAGLDVDRWFFVKAVTCLMGPAAEAKFRGIPLDEVLWNTEVADNDLADIMRCSNWAGQTPDETKEMIYNVVDTVTGLMEQPGVWPAIVAVANALKHGRNEGRHLMAIVAQEQPWVFE